MTLTRLAKIQSLSAGSHPANGNGHVDACVMEAVAYVAGEPWSDHPQCACPVIAAFLRLWNDVLDTKARNRLLRPLIPRLIGTRGSSKLEARRATMAADWYVRVATPAFLRLAGLTQHADTLASFPEIISFANTPSLRPALEAARSSASAAESAAWNAAESAAWSAAWSAVESAARSAAWSAVESAAWSAAESAAESAVESAARSAAWSAAWNAAESAAWSAAWSAVESAADQLFTPVVADLQKSALALVERMIDAK